MRQLEALAAEDNDEALPIAAAQNEGRADIIMQDAPAQINAPHVDQLANDLQNARVEVCLVSLSLLSLISIITLTRILQSHHNHHHTHTLSQ